MRRKSYLARVRGAPAQPRRHYGWPNPDRSDSVPVPSSRVCSHQPSIDRARSARVGPPKNSSARVWRVSVAPESFPVAPVTGPEALNSPVAKSIVRYRWQKQLRALTQVGVRVMHSLRQALDSRSATRLRQLLISGDASPSRSYVTSTGARPVPICLCSW
jgi:hypothetical protein